MYGSQFHLEQSLTTKRASTTELKNFIPEKSSKRSWPIISAIFIILSISTASFAGPSQPKLAGGNGNANGRP